MFTKIDLKIMKENRTMEDIKKALEKLNNNRKVDNEFKSMLIDMGFKIEKGQFKGCYEYGEQEFIRIGKRLVWLVEEKCAYSDVVLARKYRIDVINEIEEALEEEKEIYEEEMKSICSFFNKYEN
jgi:hypothetical protein